jgi:hypothetical protein
MFVTVCRSDRLCDGCGGELKVGAPCVDGDGGPSHLGFAAKRDAAATHRALLAFAQEVPHLADHLAGTEALRIHPSPLFLHADLPRSAEAAEALWRQLVPPSTPEHELIEGLRQPLPAPSGWSERFRLWHRLVESSKASVREWVVVLRSLNAFRDHLAGLRTSSCFASSRMS